MNQTLTSFATSKKPRFFLLLLFAMLSFQQGNAQHCFPGFHFTVNGNTVAFDDQSTADGTITGYVWDFGDGNTSTEQNPTHTYAVPGTYNVCLTITAHNPNCTATFCHHVVIHHPPPGECHAAFAVHQPDPTEPTFDFTDQSTSDGNIGTWEWDFGDGNTTNDQNPSHTYAAPGVYLVCLTITDDDGGCTSHVCHHIVVHHTPPGECHAAFVAHQPNPNFQTIHFTDQSTSDGNIGSWEWDFGDGNTSTDQNPIHTYAEPGTYLVCLTITDDDGGCTSHVCHHAVVHHPPPSECHAVFTYHLDPHGLGVQFTNTSTGTTAHTTYLWDFGDGTTSTLENPHHTYAHPGHYTVCLFIADTTTDCSSHICYNINVHHGGHHHFHDPHNDGNKAVSALKDESPTERSVAPIELMVVYPNPVVDFVKIVFQVQVAANVKFEIYSLTSAKVAALAESVRSIGEHTQIFSVGNLTPGVYVLKMTVDGVPHIQQIVVQR